MLLPRLRICLGFALAALTWAPAVAAPPRLVVTHASLVTLERGEDAPIADGYLVVGADGRIVVLGAGAPPAEFTGPGVATLDATGKIVMPGFLSGHSHLWQSAWRGIAADQWVTVWVKMIHRTYGPFFAPGDLHAFTLHGALDYLRHGITTTYNYSQNLGFPPAMYEEQFQAELEAGQRFVFGYALTPTPSVAVVGANFRQFMDRVHAAPPSPLFLGVNLASAGLRTSPDYTKFEFDLAREFGIGVSMHYLEPPASQEADRKNFPWIEAAGGLGPKLNFAHFIHPDDEMIAKVGAAHGAMIWNPLSNGRLASGLADIPKYLKAGIRVGMGIDGQASADISDPFENVRLGLYAQRMKYQSPTILQPIDVLRLHTIGTAEVFGVADQVGSLKAGKLADFLVVDPGDTGPVFDLYATLVFACSSANLERIYVGGECVAEHGKLLKHDFAAVAREVQERVDAVRARLAAAPKNATQ